MNSVDAWTKLMLAVGGVLTGLGVIVRAAVKRFPPKATGLAAEVATLRSEVEAARAESAAARAEAAAGRTESREEIAAVRADLRLATDYAHDLRADYSEATGKPPRDWPPGLRQ